MTKVLIVLTMTAVMLLAACGKPASIESVESLVRSAERLKELRAQCKADHAKVGDAQCNAVAEATRQRFTHPMPSPYADDPVRPRSPSVAKD
jgi:hypothetical protein